MLLRNFKRFVTAKLNRLRGLKIPATSLVMWSAKVHSSVKIGEYAYVGPRSIVYPDVEIGDYTMLANDVQIIGGDHKFDEVGVPIQFSGRYASQKTRIGKDVWIGANVIIICGVQIGNGSIVAAGSVVTKSIDENSIYGGVPCRKIKNRFTSSEFIKHMKGIKENGTPKFADKIF